MGLSPGSWFSMTDRPKIEFQASSVLSRRFDNTIFTLSELHPEGPGRRAASPQ
jgi:hypothetical protein